MSRLKDKAAIVTGAGSGIGRATALRFAKEGAHVLLAGRRQSTVAQVAEEIRGFGGIAVALEVDVAIEEQVRDMIDATLSAFVQTGSATVGTTVTNANLVFLLMFKQKQN